MQRYSSGEDALRCMLSSPLYGSLTSELATRVTIPDWGAHALCTLADFSATSVERACVLEDLRDHELRLGLRFGNCELATRGQLWQGLDHRLEVALCFG